MLTKEEVQIIDAKMRDSIRRIDAHIDTMHNVHKVQLELPYRQYFSMNGVYHKDDVLTFDGNIFDALGINFANALRAIGPIVFIDYCPMYTWNTLDQHTRDLNVPIYSWKTKSDWLCYKVYVNLYTHLPSQESSSAQQGRIYGECIRRKRD